MANQKPQHRRKSRRSVTPSRASTPIARIKQTKQTSQATGAVKKQRLKAQQGRRRIALAHAATRNKRTRWAAIAAETQEIVLGDGKYVEERSLSSAPAQPSGEGSPAADARVVHDVAPQILLSRQGTVFHPHYSQSLASWATTPAPAPATPAPPTAIEFVRRSTLAAARQLVSGDPTVTPAVLSAASSKRPGGGYLNGGDEQEETIARSSSLIASLTAGPAAAFYKEHKDFKVQDGSGLQDHAMVYSPGVVVFRRDPDDGKEGKGVGGDFIAPYTANVLSCVPVNVATIHRKYSVSEDVPLYEGGIRHAMKERMARALRAFEAHGDKHIVLGAFGCGARENRVDMVAGIWAELLECGSIEGGMAEARFKTSFRKVVFAVPGKLFEPFKKAYEMRVFEEQVSRAAITD